MLNLNGMLSIVMPAYNEEKLIYHSIMEKLLKSLFLNWRLLWLMMAVRIIPKLR